MFNSSLIYELSALKDYALPLLKVIDKDIPEYSEAKRLSSMLEYFESIPEKYIFSSSYHKGHKSYHKGQQFINLNLSQKMYLKYYFFMLNGIY